MRSGLQGASQRRARRNQRDPEGEVCFVHPKIAAKSKHNYGTRSHDESSHQWSTTHDWATGLGGGLDDAMRVPHHIKAAVQKPFDENSGNAYSNDCVISSSKKKEEHHVVPPWISDDHVSIIPATAEKASLTSRPKRASQLIRQQEEADRRLAEKLQAELDHDLSPSSSLAATELTTEEKAFDFTLRLIACFEKMMEELPVKVPISSDQDSDLLIHPALELTLVNTDALVFQAQKVFATQQEFSRNGKDTHVDTGYHYTHRVNMVSIKQSGLLSVQERAQMSSPSANTNGSLFGDGIYTANNPFSYHMFGGADVGLIVARLKGRVEVSSDTSTTNVASAADTILGRGGSTDETCVLRSGSQCLALLQFNAATINIHRDDTVGNRIIYEAQKRIQLVVDECFNKGRPKTVVRSLRATKAAVRALLTPLQYMRNKVMLYHNSLVEIIYYEAPTAVETGWHHPQRPLWIDTKQNPQPFVLQFPQFHNDRQPQSGIHERWLPEMICSAPLPPDTTASSPPSDTTDASKTKPKFLFPCDRSIDISFARKGLKQDAFQWEEIFDNMPILKRLRKYAIDHCDKCATCRSRYRKPDGYVGVGQMPTGTMRIDAFPLYKCSGFDVGTYVISYRFNEGVQSGYHPSPDQPYVASYRVCFLPMSAEGTMLLDRLKAAFVQGLTTTIGTSKTTGFENSIVWASIPHKTKTTPGRYGFPDLNFFAQANQALDLLGVVRATSSPIATASPVQVLS